MDDIKKFEDHLELGLVNIEDENDIVWLVRLTLPILKSNLRKKIKGKAEPVELYSRNPFVPFLYADGDIPRAYPAFVPANEMYADIFNLKKVFNGKCAVVSCKAKDKRFLFLDPIFDERKYALLPHHNSKIKLASISIPSPIGLIESEDPLEFVPDEPDISKGIYPYYSDLFDVVRVTQRKGDYAILEVTNNFDRKGKLELVLNCSGMDDLSKIRRVATDCYFIGSPED